MVYKLLLDQITLLVTLLDPNAPLTFLEAFYLGNGTIAFTKLGDELIAKGGVMSQFRFRRSGHLTQSPDS
jgi:hypothetical protein